MGKLLYPLYKGWCSEGYRTLSLKSELLQQAAYFHLNLSLYMQVINPPLLTQLDSNIGLQFTNIYNILPMPPYLPAAFRFKPSDLELIKHYLLPKVLGVQLPSDAVIEGDVYGDDAQLPEDDDIGDRELHMFVKIKKNQNGTRTRRMTKNGYWKITGNKEEIKDESGNCIGTMRSLELVEQNKSGRKKKLLMDEYTLDASLEKINSQGWVLCRIKQSNFYDFMCIHEDERPNSQEEEEEGDGLTSRPTASPALQGIDMDCFDLWDPSITKLWMEMETPTLPPTEPPTFGGFDYSFADMDIADMDFVTSFFD